MELLKKEVNGIGSIVPGFLQSLEIEAGQLPVTIKQTNIKLVPPVTHTPAFHYSAPE